MSPNNISLYIHNTNNESYKQIFKIIKKNDQRIITRPATPVRTQTKIEV